MAHEERKDKMIESENLKEILGVVSTEIPTMIKTILSSVFSEEAGKNMGKAAAAYYKELKNGGLPEAVAVKMTEDYMKTFTSIGDMLKTAGRGNWGHHGHGEDDEMSKQIHKHIQERLQKSADKEGEDE